MEQTLFAMSLGIAAAVLLAHQASAGPQCGPRDDVLRVLGEKYQETRRGMGMAGPNQVMELFAAEESGTWTLLVTRPDGLSCLVASGDGFEAMREELPAKGDPA